MPFRRQRSNRSGRTRSGVVVVQSIQSGGFAAADDGSCAIPSLVGPDALAQTAQVPIEIKNSIEPDHFTEPGPSRFAGEVGKFRLAIASHLLRYKRSVERTIRYQVRLSKETETK